MLQNDLILSLSVIVGKDAVLSGESATPYCSDWRGRYSGNALAVVFPSDTQQVSGVVKLCAANNVAIVPQGGNTSLCGGSVPLSQSLGGGQIVLNLSRMNQFRSIDPINYTMTVEADPSPHRHADDGVERAVRLSIDRYCSVIQTIRSARRGRGQRGGPRGSGGVLTLLLTGSASVGRLC